ncbi:serine-rich adhesin for platelets-like isoform X2 [Belonocnema kinseyi]|uniref:serine-rich adhesin for platelets-like isoform X2 n=1 Tax=Belonocnema kinseyi TaxID=2817044 RepID=UPI00143D2FCF|nr:serine-rich adhesin for platelets-like isoform X2 [Belonocnema kinseyi]
MELRFSRCSVAPLLLLLLFVAANALRGSDVQVDEQKLPVPSGRGSSRFNTKSAKIIYTSSTPTPTLKTSSRKGSQSRKTNGSNSRTNDERILKSTTLKSASTESKRNLNFESRKTLDKGRTTPATLEEVRTTSQKSVINKKGSARRHLPEGRNAKQGRKIEKVTASPVEPPKDSPKFHKESFRPSSRQVERNPSRKFENAPSGQLEKNRPSVFSGSSSSEISRSRTGRKTQPTYSSRELQSEVPDSKRFASRRSGNVNISRKDIDLKRDSLPSGSENIDVNVGTFVEVTKRSISTSTTSEEPQRQARADNEFRRSSDRGTRSRGRTSSTESSQTEESGNNSGRGNLRRGSSRSSEQSKVTESPELNRRSGVRFSKDEVDMIRPRNPETKSRAENGESKSRGRRPDVRNQSVNTQRTVSQEGPRRSGNKTPDSRTKPPEVKNQDPDSRKRSRIRSRVENTTSKVPDQTTSSPDVVTVVPEVFGTVAQTELNLETTTINLLHSGTLPTTMTSRSATTVAPANRSITKATSRATRRESEGTTRTGERTGAPRRRASKEDFYNHGLGFRGRRPMTDPTTGATITSTPVPAVVSASTTVAPGVQQRGFSGWTLNRRPYPSYSGAESSQVTTAEESTTTSGMTTKPAGRRGNKTFVKTSGDSSLVSKTESLEGENYPADFKAKLAQLKNLANSSQGAIPPPRSPLQGHKKSPSAHFSARSRTKLENALKLVKPELLDEETDSKTTSGPQNEQTIFDHENNRRLENRLSEINSESSLGQESVVKPEWKLKTETNPKNEKRSSKSRVKQGDSFTSRSKTIGEDTENSILESSTEVSRIEKSKVSFKSRNKSQVEINKSEIDNSIRKGKSGSSSREKKIPENVTVTTIKPKRTSPRRSVKNPEEEASKFKPRKPVSRYRNALKNPVQNHLQNTATTEKPRPKSYSLRRLKTYDSITLNPRDEEATMIPTVSNFPAETTITPVTKNYLSVTKSVITKVSEEISTKRLKASAFHDLSKTSESGDRNSKKLNYKSENLNEVPNDDDDSTTIKIVRPTSRYARKKTDLSKTLSPTSKSSLSVLKTANSVSKENQKGTQRREFQPRTATYRRHLELPLGLVRSLTAQPNSIATIPKAERLQAAITSTSRSPLLVRQKPTVSVVSNNSNSSQQQSLGVLNSSNRSSNIFSPTRSVLLTAGNNSLLEQIRSTVAPLLGSLAARSPVFSGVFNNETNVNTAVRITPNGSPPRFSARYKGAELFVRKPSIYQQNIPSITSSSSPFTPVENPSLPPPIEVSNNGEPKIVTFYQALESASITNEQLKTNLEQLGRVAQVDRPTDNDPNGTNSSNNETETITITVITSSSTTDTTMILDTTQSPEATPRALDATQSPENTPTTSESPITSKVTTIYEISPPLTMITPLMEVFELNEVSTTTISATTIEDTTTQSSFSDILTNDIEDSSPETPNVETTTSDDLEAESVVSNTESSSNTQVFTLTPVTMESSSQMSRSETTTTVNEIIFVSDSSVSNETTTESQSESPTTQMTSTESFMTSTEMTTDSVATEARFSTNSVDFPPMMLSTISTMVEASPTRVPSISEEPSTLASLMKTQSTTMSSTAETPSTTVLSIAETPLTAMPTTTDTMSTTLLLSTTETPSMTEMPSTTETSSTTQLPSTTETPSTTLLPSTKSFQLRTTRPTSDPSTIITVTGYPRFPKLQSFLEALAQLRETTTKSQVIQVNSEMTTPFNEPTLIMDSTNSISTTLSSAEMPNTFPTTLPSTADQTTILPPMSQENVSNSSLNIEINLEENITTTTEIDLASIESSTILSTQPRIAMTEDEFINMTQTWINDSDSDSVLPFDNDLLSRLMNVASKLFSKPLNATQSQLLQKTLENTDRSSLDKLPSLLGGFLDHTDRNHTTESTAVGMSTTLEPRLETPEPRVETPVYISSPMVEQTTETIETTSTSDSSSLTSDSLTNDAQQTTTALDLTTETTDTFSTNPPQTQTASILDLYAMLSDLVTKAPATPPALEIDSRIQETTLTPTSTEQTQMDTTPATAQGTAGANMISSKLVEFSTTPTLMIPTTTPIPTTSMNPTTIPAPKSSTVPDATTMVTQTPEPTTTNNEIERSLISSQQPITTSTATATTTTEPTTTLSTTTSSNTASSTTVPTISNQTTPYLGRFGGSRITPAPRFSSSSSTIAPLRDYLVYGIYPNKTIVRKRPEDNLIDARNIDSPYVIFGIYPDGRLVRKFPNGTVIPDPPSNPVEVVFSLSTTTTTTTTNRPSPSVIVDNQANQGFNNQNAALSNNRSPVATLDSQNGLLNPTDVDNGLSGNSIEPAGPASPVSPTVGSIGSTTQKMVIDAQKATSSVPSATSSSSSNSNVAAGSNGSQQGGRIIQDRERDEATRTREAGGQRSSVYIGQDKFINYWTNDQPNTNPQVLNVKINSVSTAATAGSSSEPKTSFDILPKIGTGAQVTAPPGFPWKDSLEQIFGITTNPPSISASVASNVLDDVNPGNRPIKARPVNSFVEIFSPISTRASAAITAAAIPTSSSTSTTTTTTSTTTSSPPRITIPSGLFTTNMPKQNAFGTTFDDLAFLNTLLNTPKFGGTTPKTLTEVEQLLANKILSLALGKAGPTRSPKAIQPSNASPNLLIDTDPNSESGPVIIDLYPSSTTPKPPATWKPVTSTSPIVVNPWKTILNSIAANQIRISTPNSLDNLSEDLRPVFNQQQTSTSTTTTTPRTITTLRTTTTAKTTTTPRTTTTPSTTTSTSTTTTTIRTTPKSSESTRQVVITAKPRTTTPLPLAIGDNLLSVLFGGNLFGTPTTPPPVINSNPVGTTKSVSTTQRIQTTERVLSNTQFPFLENTNQNLAPLFNHESTSTTTTTPRTTSPSTTTTTTTPKTTTPSTTTTTSTTTPSTTASTTTTTKTTRTTPRSSGSTRQVVITAKPRPRTTTPAPLGFGANLLRALFGGNFFGRQTTTPPPVRTRQPVTTFRRPATITKPVLTTQRILTTERVVSNIQIPSSTQGPIQLTPEVKVSKEKVNANLEAASSTAVGVNDQNSKLTEKQSSTFSPEDDAKFLMALLQAAQEMKGETESSTLVSKTAISKDDDSFLRAILSGQAKDPAGSGKGETGVNNAALLAAFLKAEGIEPPSPANQLREQLLLAGEKNRESRSSTTSEPQTSTTTTRKTTTRPRPAAPTWKPSSTYPPPLFGGFNFGGSSDSFRGNTNSNTGEDNVRSQVVNAAIGVTRAFSQFLGGAIRGAAKQLQTFVGNGTRSFFS